MGSIGFDLRALQYGFKAHKNRGIGVYTRNLIERRSLAPADLALSLFFDPEYEADEPLKYGSTPYDHGWTYTLKPFVKEYIWQHFLFKSVVNSTIKRTGVEAFFFPSHLDVPAGLKAPYAVMAHDMIHVALKGLNSRSFKHRLHVAKQLDVLKNARLIMANSNHTKEDVVKHARVEPAKVVVAPLGVGPEFKPGGGCDRASFKLPERFILYVGGIDWRKNIKLLFDTFSKLLNVMPDYHLVMTGDIENDPMYRQFIATLRERSLESRVHSLGFVSKEKLVSLYNSADVFFYPSLYEGFGLPVLEAMACGAPVITTNRGSIPEVAGDAATLLDPDDPESFFEALKHVLDSESERDRMSKAGIARAAKFSWDRMAEETYKALATL